MFLRNVFRVVLASAALASIVGSAHAIAIQPDFQRTYWWTANGTQIDGDQPREALIKVEQKDYYRTLDRQGLPPITVFTYQVTNLAYRTDGSAAGGYNGLSGFDILDISPFTYTYMSQPTDPVTGNPWEAISGPGNDNAPQWEALWGFDLFGAPNTQGLYDANDPNRPAGALDSGFFSYYVDGWVNIGDVNADFHSWGADEFQFPIERKVLHGLVSGPINTIPEPKSMLLLAAGLVGLAVIRKRS